MTGKGKKQLDRLTTLKPEEKTAVKEFAGLLKDKFGPVVKEIILFGSKVRGESREDSDIDILIVLNKLSWDIKKTISELAAMENIKHDVLISTIRYLADKWEDPVIKASPFAASVKEEGVWL